ncbi:MAG: MoaD/ThiS family protein [Acidobacteriota bacterium]
MPRVSFTSHLRRYLECLPADVPGQTVRELLDAVFSGNPKLRGYVLDDQGHLRQHVVVFVDDRPVRDRVGLSDRVEAESEVFVLQALSGG